MDEKKKPDQLTSQEIDDLAALINDASSKPDVSPQDEDTGEFDPRLLDDGESQ